MNILFFILCLVPQSVDTLWTVEFSSQPSGWIAGPNWEYTEESVYLYLHCGSGYPGYYFQEDSLISPDFVVPPSADSLVLIFDHNWWGHGSREYVFNWAMSTSRLDMFNSANPSYPIVLWGIAAGSGSPISDYPIDTLLSKYQYSLTDSGSVFIPLTGLTAGDTLSFVFSGLVEAFVLKYDAWAYIEWDIYTFSILNYPSVSLEPSTWGMIKASF